MNTTVARIVEIMFQDTVMSDEVQAIKDEVMNNCQERYQDMLARGMSEDDAIAAVIDSLKGMEEVIVQYPKVQAETPADEAGEQDLVFSAQQVKRVKVFVTSDDVDFESSCDDYVHVYYNKEKMPNLVVEACGDTLNIRRENKVEVNHGNGSKKSEWSWQFNSFSDLLSGIGKMLENVHVNVVFGGGEKVVIALPADADFAIEVNTTSGDVSIDDVCVKNVMVATTSGDVEINLNDNVVPEEIKVKGASGDAEVNASARSLHLNTVSGDVVAKGSYDSVFVNTVSGDGEVSGSMREVKLNSVSGDMALYARDELLRKVHSNTTSGDVSIHLPASLRGQVSVQMNSMSGDKRNSFGEVTGAPLVHVQANSVSGDVTVC